MRRKARSESFFAAYRGHVHHQLVDLGMGRRDAMLLLLAAGSAAVKVLAIPVTPFV